MVRMVRAARPRCGTSSTPSPVPPGEVVRSTHFHAELVTLPPGGSSRPDAHMCQLWICTAGEGVIGTEAVRAGEVWLLAEEGDQPEVQSANGAKFLRTWVPD